MDVRRLSFVLALGVAAPMHAQERDTFKWMHSQLSAGQFIAVDAESKQGPSGTWMSQTDTWQPFKSIVDPLRREVYWRKDDISLADSWYGELFYFDDTNVYLHSETFPGALSTTAQPWDARIDRFRLFLNADGSGKGRIIAPSKIPDEWNVSQTLNTYVCGVTGTPSSNAPTDGFRQVNSDSCMPFQAAVSDSSVTISFQSNYDILEGESPAENTPTGTPEGTTAVEVISNFDQVMIIEQVLANTARERFIFGYKGGKYYGIVRWDNATGSPGNWRITDRTIGLKVVQLTAGEFDFDGMTDRSDSDLTLPPAAPTGFAATCVPDTDLALLTWAPVPNATKFDVSVDDGSDAWLPNQAGSNDTVFLAHPGTSILYQTIPGHSYHWWINSSNLGGKSPAAGSGSVFVACQGALSITPPAPAGPVATVRGDLATLSWEPSPGATSYDIRIDDATAGPWTPGRNGDTAVNDFNGTSLIFRLTPGHQYHWWLDARNDVGGSDAEAGSDFSASP